MVQRLLNQVPINNIISLLALEFQAQETMRMSDPKHFDHILPFLQPADAHHTVIPLTDQEVVRMHAKDDVPVAVDAPDLQTD